MTSGTTRKPNWKERAIAAVVVIGLGAGVAALMVHNRRMANEIARGIYVPRQGKITPEILLLQQYIRIDTSNPPGNELPGAQWLGAQLQRAGIPYEIIESAPRRANLYARIKGTESGGGLLLLNHIDVVPAPASEGQWERPPFSGSIAANMLYGRGALDMKGIAVAQLEALKAVALSGRPPKHDLIFLAVADEEAESEAGIRWLLDHRPAIFEGVKYVLAEGGVTEMEHERVTYFGIEVGAKQIVELDLIAATREQLQRARIALEPWFHPRDAGEVDPGVRAFLRSVAPNRLEGQEVIADIDRSIAGGKFWLVPPLNRELLQNSVWPYGIRAEDGHYAMKVILSNLPSENPDRRLEWLLNFVAPYGVSAGRITHKQGPAPTSSPDTPFFTLIEREIAREIHPARIGPEVLPMSTSDARFLRQRGITCYGLLPFPVDFFQTQGIHGPDERVRLDWFMSGVRATKSIVSAYVAGE